MGRASRTKRDRPRLLYHFTSEHHLPSILRDGVLRMTESNASFVREHAAPDVVWLLDAPTADAAPHGLDPADPARVAALIQAGYTVENADKRAVRITVRAGAAERWDAWSRGRYDAEARSLLVRSGGGSDAARHWWVSVRPIPRDEWVAVDRRDPDGAYRPV